MATASNARYLNWVWCSLCCWLLLASTSVLAHPADNSLIQIDIRDSGLRVHVQLPVEQLYMAEPALFPKGQAFDSIDEALPAWSDFDQAAMISYLKKHLHLFMAADGPDPLNPSALPRVRLAAQPQINNMSVVVSNNSLQFKALLDVPFPDPGIRNSRAWRWLVDTSLINHRVRNHKTLITLGSDALHGRDGSDPGVLGIVGYQSAPLVITSDPGSSLTLLTTLIKQGVMHILAGFDHLLFLICLLLAAPLRIRQKRWEIEPDRRQALWNLLTLVSAFSLGHTLTLALASLGFVSVSSHTVEIAVAGSLLISAGYLLWPLSCHRITVVATLFGLVHGLAFASELGNDGFALPRQLLMLGGFAIGIELAQVGICLLVMPCLLELARHRAGIYHRLRQGGAVFTLTLASGWAIERTFNVSNPLQLLQDQLPLILLGIYLLVLASSLASLASRPASQPTVS
ncbi:HupE/UreJ family protein [Parathalassolituus penaei]|uniref:HupE/UreJ family protein n=1 Tax=Parathalassolituus penaei TaxID=2997323 RepID=A0A9X3IS24_9GAMM|nr:HupE/UreJ family protein [Parathalassolituus penaei]MCY0965872.1 HupE/UreJ family protein [Parathalassolituus penaei]